MANSNTYLPGTDSGWDGDSDCMQFDDFGEFKAGEKYMAVTVNFDKTVSGYQDGAEAVKRQKFAIVPIPTSSTSIEDVIA